LVKEVYVDPMNGDIHLPDGLSALESLDDHVKAIGGEDTALLRGTRCAGGIDEQYRQRAIPMWSFTMYQQKWLIFGVSSRTGRKLNDRTQTPTSAEDPELISVEIPAVNQRKRHQ
jgi:hypothetical protein